MAENAPVFAEQLARFAAVNGVAAAAKLVDLLYKAQILDIPRYRGLSGVETLLMQFIEKLGLGGEAILLDYADYRLMSLFFTDLILSQRLCASFYTLYQ